MLDKLTHADIAGRLRETFRLILPEGEPMDLELVDAAAVGGTPAERAPFSVVFRGPPEPVLPQAIYRLEHGELGRLDLFLVPIGPAAGGMDYEAVFT